MGEVWIDRGGTFPDVIGRAPDGTLHVTKLLSAADDAPAIGVRSLLARAIGLAPEAPLPPCTVKLGTTVATNALLERRGVRTLLVANRGLGDVLEIGTQERPDLFALRIEKPAPLHERVLEAAGRAAPDGALLEPPDPGALAAGLAAARAEGFEAVACVAIHAPAHPSVEEGWAAAARASGFPYVAASHEVANELGLLARGETTVADAYLTPLLRRHVAALGRALPGARLRFMQSSGGLTDGARFRGPTALLSGPAGGVVGAGRVARAAGCAEAIGFDMGGTSTDVSLLRDGEAERAFETVVAGLRVRAPMVLVHTVAAGGGSLCRFDGFRLTVGPESAGADPRPLCYGRHGPGGERLARELALTDVNVFLGRLPPDRFPIALDPAPIGPALDALRAALAGAGHPRSRDELAAGFLEVANATMAQAIQQVSVARGVDPRGCALVGFGGAGGQHVCQLARALGIRTILLHPLAGLLSAYGIGASRTSWDGQRDAGRARLGPDGAPPPAVSILIGVLADEGRAALRAEGVEAARVEASLDLRYAGAETALPVAAPADGDWAAAFQAAHEARFGYARRGRAIEVTTARVRVRAPDGEPLVARAPAPPAHRQATPRRRAEAWFPGAGRVSAALFDREALAEGDVVDGPAIVLEDTGTVVIDPGFRATVSDDGVLRLEDRAGAARPATLDPAVADPVRLEVLGNRFMSIAEQMGAVLRNTAVSTNIKERLDYSCAVFDGEGGLVANAPHIPVHLGAMQETVRALRAAFPDPEPGDVWVTNDPFAGGSHLPDVTVVTPVFVAEPGGPHFYVGSRGHHADIGGRAPGSMPADSRSLAEEGVVLPPLRLVRSGRLDEASLRARLEAGPHPARNPDDNVADLEAQVAANRWGADALRALAGELGPHVARSTMRQLQDAAAAKVRREIARLPAGEHRFADRLDDGTPVVVAVRIEGGSMEIDFTGTGAAHAGNLNAPRAVVAAAVLYVLRALVAESIPLNGGCLLPVSIRVPPGSLLDPPPGSAVVGGNVETSQRIVDVLLGALGLAAASQGTMNNVAFGDEHFGYYETIGGGAGAGPGCAGASGVHVHMTNTRITDAEVLETRFPVRLVEFSLRRGSGGAGRYRGGDGLVRRYEMLAPLSVSLLAERRSVAPWGLAGGGAGAPGRHVVERRDGAQEQVSGRASLALAAGDRLRIETPGGGGWGDLAGAEGAP
ncbi:MAG TPA: hydantoinase B/oxoprolinase family protein [Myxococcota bacterium]|nr:hydantoinase B/oxoprolinase family protein [Myxococcota bacterium]